MNDNERGRETKSPTGQSCVKRNFSLTPEIFDNLKAESERSGVPMSQIVRWALEDYFSLAKIDRDWHRKKLSSVKKTLV